MGGNALKHTETRRYAAEAFHPLAAHIVQVLREALPGRRIEAIPAYRAKADFGDLDVLVASQGRDLAPVVEALFAPSEMVRNGPVLSFNVGQLQVDLINARPEEYAFSLAYFSFNDLGNLIGRIAHAGGFKFGHDGLSYLVREGTHLVKTLLLTRDHDAALAFLGYDAALYRALAEHGFNDREDLYRFVVTSLFFDPALFPLEHRSHRARVRDAKRPTYQGFLAWLAEQRPDPGISLDREQALERARAHFPDFGPALEAAREDLARRQRLKDKFNGRRVRELTGRRDLALGQLMQAIRTSFVDERALWDWMEAASPEAIAARVRAVDVLTFPPGRA